MPGLNIAAGAVLAVALAVNSCATRQSRIQPLAPDLERWSVDAGKTSCSSLQGQFRIAVGIEPALKIEKYRLPLLHELSGPGNDRMSMEDAVALGRRSSSALGKELDRRCPDHKITRREDIVYVPQQF